MTALTIDRKSQKPRRDSIINLRIPAHTRDLLDEAAEAVGKSRTQFVVDSARAQALDILLDQRVFTLSEKAFAEFIDILDRPSKPNDQLRELFARKPQWEK